MIKKAASKRIKVTKSGKVLRRKMGASHFKAKKSSKQKQAKRRPVKVTKADQKAVVTYMKGR